MLLARGFAALVLLLAMTAASPAWAHPFGPPPTARVSAEGSTVTIDWSATPDDAAAIGEQLGILPPGSVAAYRQDAAAQVAPPAADEARLSASPQLRDYLTSRITAAQAGEPCDGSVPPVADFVHSGARVVLDCPDPVAEIELSITMLHDLNPAYRTVAVGTDSDPAQGVFTTQASRATWRFGAPAASGSPLVPLAATGAVAVVVIALYVRLRRSAR